MLFIFPKWDTENERIGLSKCCPISSKLRLLAEFGGFIGLLWLTFTIGYLLYKAFIGEFLNSLLFLLLYPYILGIINMSMFLLAYHLAEKKSYNYDGELKITSWLESGKEKSFKE